ncbi:annexin A13-like [Telopea speciosissima]|uniref:annexin A13-like n=1 Tax=Telopea speciosissima TaxID=54955 RepID=UPI001CC39E49|nr:annexin A13-like [Telopea speciosissima]
MATNPSSSSQGFQRDCREIHDSKGQLNYLVRTLACRTQLERQQLRETYMAMYGEDLLYRLQKMTQVTNQNNEIYELLSLWMLEQCERDTIVANDAIELRETNYKVLIEIYVGRKSSHIHLVKQAYQAKFKRQLEQDIISSEPPNSYQKILIALSTSHKSHHADVSQHVAKCDARRFYETGEGRIGAMEESVVLEILSKRSIPQLRLTFSCYKHIYGHSYTKSLKKEISGEFEDALRVVVECMCCPPPYYAKTLFASINGSKTDKSTLAHVIVSRAEIDMDEIKVIFKKKYGIELKDAISENVPSGNYRDFLVALVTR